MPRGYAAWVCCSNRRQNKQSITHMTIKQKILRFFYSLLMKVQESGAKRQVKRNTAGIAAPVSFYNLHAELANGSAFDFTGLQGKHVLLVNVASECGYTSQYAELETLYRQHQNNLVILGFPANDFKGQEPGTDADIASFCTINFGVSFPLFKKQSVLKPQQNSVYAWLSDALKNGWNNQQPTWNFCKYLVDEKGHVVKFYPSKITPLSPELLADIAK